MKHEWIKKGNGEVDDFAASSGFCNGPMCRLCGFSFCQHCEPEGYEDENCPGYPTAENIELYLGNKKRYYAFIVEDNGKERVDADWVEISPSLVKDFQKRGYQIKTTKEVIEETR